jgi:hypothetical protein
MADWNQPTNASAYTGVLATLNEKIANAAKMDFTGDTNVPAGAIRLNSRQLQSWNGSAWVRAAYDPAPWGGTSGGSANSQTLTLDPAWTAYLTGVPVFFLPGFSNNGALTININGLGTRTVQYMGQACVGGEVVTNVETAIIFDGTNFELLRHGGGWATWTPTYGASGSMNYTANGITGVPTTLLGIYQRHGSRVDFALRASGVNGGTASNTLTFTAPITAASSGQSAGGGMILNGSTETGAYWQFGSTSTIQIKRYDQANLTTSVTTFILAEGFYTL